MTRPWVVQIRAAIDRSVVTLVGEVVSGGRG